MAKKGQWYIPVRESVEDYTNEELIELGKRMVNRRLGQKRYLQEHSKEAVEAVRRCRAKQKESNN